MWKHAVWFLLGLRFRNKLIPHVHPRASGPAWGLDVGPQNWRSLSFLTDLGPLPGCGAPFRTVHIEENVESKFNVAPGIRPSREAEGPCQRAEAASVLRRASMHVGFRNQGKVREDRLPDTPRASPWGMQGCGGTAVLRDSGHSWHRPAGASGGGGGRAQRAWFRRGRECGLS